MTEHSAAKNFSLVPVIASRSIAHSSFIWFWPIPSETSVAQTALTEGFRSFRSGGLEEIWVHQPSPGGFPHCGPLELIFSRSLSIDAG
jgi:hypothetical protein